MGFPPICGLFDYASLSYNVQAFTNPHWLKLLADPAQRSACRVVDLASAGLSADTASMNFRLAVRGPNGPMRECGVI